MLKLCLLLVLIQNSLPLEKIVRLLRIEIPFRSLSVGDLLPNEERLPCHLPHRWALRELYIVLSLKLYLTLVKIHMTFLGGRLIVELKGLR